MQLQKNTIQIIIVSIKALCIAANEHMQSERIFRAVAFFLTLKLYNVRKFVATMHLEM